MVESDSLNAFFEQSKLTDNRSSYTASYSASTSTKNAYTFYNISNLVTKMHNAKLEGEKKNPNWVSEHPNWNKVMLVPVTLKTSTINNSTVVTKINHDMSLSSTRLVKATDDANKDYTLDNKTSKEFIPLSSNASFAIGMNVAWGGVNQDKLEKESKKKAIAAL